MPAGKMMMKSHLLRNPAGICQLPLCAALEAAVTMTAVREGHEVSAVNAEKAAAVTGQAETTTGQKKRFVNMPCFQILGLTLCSSTLYNLLYFTLGLYPV